MSLLEVTTLHFVFLFSKDEDKATGEKKPGKKGIALNSDQWAKVVASINQIQTAVDEMK